MVKSIVSFENIDDYRYRIKNGRILCEHDDMLMEIIGTFYSFDAKRIPIFVGEDVKNYFEKLCSTLGDSGYSPIHETSYGEFLVWVCIKKDSHIPRMDWIDPYVKKDVRLIVHIDRLIENRLHLSVLLAEI